MRECVKFPTHSYHALYQHVKCPGTAYNMSEDHLYSKTTEADLGQRYPPPDCDKMLYHLDEWNVLQA